MNKFVRRKGTFKPQRTDDLKDGVAACIGMYCEWEAMWVIEEGQFKGMWAMAPRLKPKDYQYCPFAWTPECDIDFDA